MRTTKHLGDLNPWPLWHVPPVLPLHHLRRWRSGRTGGEHATDARGWDPWGVMQFSCLKVRVRLVVETNRPRKITGSPWLVVRGQNVSQQLPPHFCSLCAHSTSLMSNSWARNMYKCLFLSLSVFLLHFLLVYFWGFLYTLDPTNTNIKKPLSVFQKDCFDLLLRKLQLPVFYLLGCTHTFKGHCWWQKQTIAQREGKCHAPWANENNQQMPGVRIYRWMLSWEPNTPNN